MMHCFLLSSSYRWICRPIRPSCWRITIMRRNGTLFVIRWVPRRTPIESGINAKSSSRKWFKRKTHHRTTSQSWERTSIPKHRGVIGWVCCASSLSASRDHQGSIQFVAHESRFHMRNLRQAMLVMTSICARSLACLAVFFRALLLSNKFSLW